MSCPNAANVNVVSMPPPSGCTPVEGCPGGPPVECSIADGADVAEGATTDAASGKGDNPGTVEAKLRQLVLGQSEAIGTEAAFNTGIQPVALQVNNSGGGYYVPLRDIADFGLSPFRRQGAPNSAGTGNWMIEGFVAPFGLFSLERTPGTFQSVQAVNVGNTALWTPAGGSRFRLMRYMVVVTGDASTAGGAVVTISLNDAGAAMAQDHDVFVPGAALNTFPLYNSGWIDLGNGFLSGAVNNVLNVNLSAALATGNVRVICCGTEEP